MSTPAPFALQCPPGTKMLLEVSGLEEKLNTACVGSQRGRFVIVQMPARSRRSWRSPKTSDAMTVVATISKRD